MNPTPLFHTATYQTSDTCPALQKPSAVSLRFYSSLVWLVCRAGMKAMRGTYDGWAWAKSSEETVRFLEGVGCRLEATGLEHFHQLDGPCVFVGNHMSTLETFVLPAMIQPWKEVTFVVKQSLLKYPFFGPVLSSRDPIVVHRTNPREDLVTVLEEGTKRLAQGRSVIVFPQSTRTPDFDPAQFNTIGVKLARRAGVPVLPFALKTDAWSNGSVFKDFGPIRPERTIHFAFGAPLRIEKQGKEEHRHISDYIISHLAQWQAEPTAQMA